MKIFRAIILFLTVSLLIISCGKKEKQMSDEQAGDVIEASLNEFENREKYKTITADVLKSIPDDKLEMAIIDYITEVKLNGNFKNEYRIVKNLGKGLRYIYITWNLEGEVNNGGFIQYFYNTSGVFTGEIKEAFRNINAFKTEKIAGEAIDVYNKERAGHETIKKDGSIESFISTHGESELERLDELFYKSGEDLSRLRIKYIRENPEQFITR